MKIDTHKNSHKEEKIVKEINSLRFVRLSQKEHTELWSSIVSRMSIVSPLSHQIITLRSIMSFGARMIAMVLVLVLGLGSGLTYASDDSLPGDFLYPFKVHVSEEVQSLSKKDSEERASFATKRAERRLEEVKILITEGSFDEVKSKEVVSNFEKHIKKVKKETQKLSETLPGKALIVVSNFETALEKNSIILEELKKDTGSTDSLEYVFFQVQEETIAVSEEKDRMIIKVFNDDSINEEARNIVIEEKIQQVKFQLALESELGSDIEISAVNSVEGKESIIDDNMNDKIMESRELVKEGKLNQAFTLLHNTHSDLEKKRILVKLEKERTEKKFALEMESLVQTSDTIKSESDIALETSMISTMVMIEENNHTSLSPDGLWKIEKQEKKNNDEVYEISYQLVSLSEDTLVKTLFLMKTVEKESFIPNHIWTSDSKYLVYEQEEINTGNIYITVLQLSNGEIKTTLDGVLFSSVNPFQGSFNVDTKELHYFEQKDESFIMKTYSLVDVISINPLLKRSREIEKLIEIKELLPVVIEKPIR